MEESADKNVIETETEEEEEEEVAAEAEEEDNFMYKPSKTLKEMENKLPTCEKEFVKDGMVKETLSNMFEESMKTTVAQDGLTKLNRQWMLMLEGSEASRVVGTFGENFKKIITSNSNANIINVVMSTLNVLLKKMAMEKRASGLNKILNMIFVLTGSPNMPNVINKVGSLTIMAVQKPNVPEFTRKLFDETYSLLNEKNISKKMDNYFSNVISMMKNLRGQLDTTIKSLH